MIGEFVRKEFRSCRIRSLTNSGTGMNTGRLEIGGIAHKKLNS
jgi:hypothetical protein